jgi:hypothetical protein
MYVQHAAARGRATLALLIHHPVAPPPCIQGDEQRAGHLWGLERRSMGPGFLEEGYRPQQVLRGGCRTGRPPHDAAKDEDGAL